MKISDPKSNWYIPPDWRLILGYHFVFVPAAIIAALFFSALSRGSPALLWIALAIGTVGIVMLFLAKFPLYLQRKFLTFGPKALPPRRKKLYWTAYGFIGTSIVIMGLLLAVFLP